MQNTFRDIIGLWDTPEALAEAINAKPAAVRKWKQRDSIPAVWWAAIIEAAEDRGAAITSDQLTAIAGRARKLEAAE
jgi:hypothetical protein